jgi:demethylmenaquinone methyltransferase/2-methoxy-6-polyprenyl-1,4-benzoquinol methylase
LSLERTRPSSAEEDRTTAPAMFDRIASTYDTVNSVLSLGMHHGWRKRALAHLPAKNGLRALDVATGTADIALLLLDDARVERVVGVDLSDEMLAHGRVKLAQHRRAASGTLERGDAMHLPVGDATQDVVTISFGIRNVVDIDQAFRDFARVLVPGGRLIVLEFSTPEPGAFAALYDVYRRQVLPRIGAALSGDAAAYRYLDRTIATFPSGEAMLDRIRRAGFAHAFREPLAFGAVSIYVGER